MATLSGLGASSAEVILADFSTCRTLADLSFAQTLLPVFLYGAASPQCVKVLVLTDHSVGLRILLFLVLPHNLVVSPVGIHQDLATHELGFSLSVGHSADVPHHLVGPYLQPSPV